MPPGLSIFIRWCSSIGRAHVLYSCCCAFKSCHQLQRIAQKKYKRKSVFTIKEITKEEVNALIKNGIIHNGRRGLVNKSGNTIGFYRTRNRRYIEDKYADLAKRYT